MRQVSFTLLMSWISRQQSNLVREEQFVQTAGNAVIRNDNAAKLPSDGLRLNASKSESMLVMRCYLGLPFSAYNQASALVRTLSAMECAKLIKGSNDGS